MTTPFRHGQLPDKIHDNFSNFQIWLRSSRVKKTADDIRIPGQEKRKSRLNSEVGLILGEF